MSCARHQLDLGPQVVRAALINQKCGRNFMIERSEIIKPRTLVRGKRINFDINDGKGGRIRTRTYRFGRGIFTVLLTTTVFTAISVCSLDYAFIRSGWVIIVSARSLLGFAQRCHFTGFIEFTPFTN